MALLNAIAALIRLFGDYPIFYTEPGNYKQAWAFVIEDTCFYGSTWLYAIIYFETAFDIQQMIEEDPSQSSELRVKRRKKFLCIRWTVFGAIVISHIPISIAFLSPHLDQAQVTTLIVLGFSVCTIVVIGSAVIMTIALHMFIKFISKYTDAKGGGLNHLFIFFQISSIYVWTILWVFTCVEFIEHIGNL